MPRLGACARPAASVSKEYCRFLAAASGSCRESRKLKFSILSKLAAAWRAICSSDIAAGLFRPPGSQSNPIVYQIPIDWKNTSANCLGGLSWGERNGGVMVTEARECRQPTSRGRDAQIRILGCPETQKRWNWTISLQDICSEELPNRIPRNQSAATYAKQETRVLARAWTRGAVTDRQDQHKSRVSTRWELD